jgi:16S rRNA (cytidine1402-2'-O)-methyltransferase
MLKQTSNVLFLIPVPISETAIDWSIPLEVIRQVITIKAFIVENAKTARHYLKQMNPQVNYSEINMLEMDKHDMNSQKQEIKDFLISNPSVGIMSEAGLPCIADPGNHIVKMAHELGIKVKPLSGPSSIILALIASGLNGQQFKFHGYIPSKPEERKTAISLLEKDAVKATQLFIEVPYRNDKMLEELINILRPETKLLVAIDITGNDEQIICQSVTWWKKNKMLIGKVPCIFGLGV